VTDVKYSVDAVLFDLDGTLLDSMPAIRASLSHVCDRFFPEKEDLIDRAMTLVGLPLTGIMELLNEGQADVAEMVSVYREHNRPLLDAIPFFPGALEVIIALRERQIMTGIVTTKSQDAAWKSIEAHGAARYFDVVITGDDVTKHKPHPLPILTACQRLGIDPSKVMYIGDTVADIRSAAAAGCIGGAAEWGAVDLESLASSSPDLSLGSITHLLPFLGY
jgi:pyrophosphatase PpaX